MMPQHGPPPRESLARALVLIHRYSVDLTRIASEALGDGVVENRDGQLFTAVAREGRLSPTQLGQRLAAPRSTVSRAMNRLEAAGLTTRVPDPADGRGVLVVLTPRGRRRAAELGQRLGAYFAIAAPLVKDSCQELGIVLPDSVPGSGPRPLDSFAAMTETGARYVEEVTDALAPFGVRESSERFTLALTHLYGEQRPTALADELGLRPSGVSGVLTRLEDAGLITRRHDPELGDRRAVFVELTPRGRAAAEAQLDVFARHAQVVAQVIAAPTSPH